MSEPKSYTTEEVNTAANAAADLVLNELTGSDRDRDLINLVVNATMAALEGGAESLDDVIRASYETEPAELRAWWSDWS